MSVAEYRPGTGPTVAPGIPRRRDIGFARRSPASDAAASLDVATNMHQSGAMSATRRTNQRRHRLSADVPEATEARVRETARVFYRGVVSEAVTTALDTFEWVVDARRRGKRVIATDDDGLPERFEEPVIAGLEGLGRDWQWLVRRDHPWRRQLWIKGRNLAAGDLVRTAEVEGWTPERAAEEFDLPVDAVIEAIRYAETARDLIAAEEAENRIAAQLHEQPRAPLPR